MIGALRRRQSNPGADPGADPESGPEADREQAEQLKALVGECELAGIARRACVVHLSCLGAERVRPHHRRLARAALEPLAQADRARLFTLPNQDVVAIWRGPAEMALATSRTAIMHLFVDGAGSVTAEMVWEELDLPRDAPRLLALARLNARAVVAAPVPAPAAAPLDPAALAALELQLARADMSRFARRAAVCARSADGHMRLRWEKRTLCMDELAAALSPDIDPQAEPWLFRRLTRTLDRRMLALLAAPGELAEAGPFAINLNVSSILAAEFLRFDTALPAALRGQVTLDLDPADILADPAAFLFARDFARARGYLLLLRGVTADQQAVFPIGGLGLDFLQLVWSEQLGAAAVSPAEAGQIVLGHADTPEAIEWGAARGITLFKGRMATSAPRRAA